MSFAFYGDDTWQQMRQNPLMARAFGYEFITTLQFQGNLIGLLFKELP
jgi:hypothetical protein